jgi:ATPase family AAA domain-containing protein 3A/B
MQVTIAIDNERVGQIYLDAKPANTSMHLESIRMLPLSTYRFSYDSKRKRVGVIGPILAAVIPDAVDIVPKRTLPPREKGAKPVLLENFPSVNEHILFYYSVGATQELAQMLSELSSRAEVQTREIANIYGEVTQLEKIISSSSDGGAELRMREAAAKAEIAKNEMEMTLLKAKHEQEFSETLRKLEEEQRSKIEELTFERLEREDVASRMRSEQLLKAKFDASQRIQQRSADAAEVVAAIELKQKLVLQKAAEEMKVKTAKAVAMAKADAERANEDVRIRRLQAEYEQRRKRNVAAINAVFSHLSTSLSTAVKNPKEVVTFIGYACLLATAIFVARETSRLIRSTIEATLGKPQLIRETTRKHMPWSLVSYIAQFASYLNPWACKPGSALVKESFEDLILPQELKERVLNLAHSAHNARRHNAPFRHVLLYGPPGTGG